MTDDKSKFIKAARVKTLSIDDDELAKINKLTLEPLTADDVFVYKVAMCDNEVDREFEYFPIKSLQTMQKLFIGKTMIKDHDWKSDNQVARIYDTEIVTDSKQKTSYGDDYVYLMAHCYMLKTPENASLIAEIKGGIKKEVSVGFMPTVVKCSICGIDNTKGYCGHWWGKEYDGEICKFSLENIEDAYELSFVGVPAQPKAGTVKNYGGKKESEKSNKNNKSKSLALQIAIDEAEDFLFTQNLKSKGDF